MDAELRSHVFGAVLHDEGSERARTGLGLSIVHGIAKEAGGSVTAAQLAAGQWHDVRSAAAGDPRLRTALLFIQDVPEGRPRCRGPQQSSVFGADADVGLGDRHRAICSTDGVYPDRV